MSRTVQITLQGLPEQLQAVADALDTAIPGIFEWHELAAPGHEFEIVLRGFGSWGAALEHAKRVSITG